MGLVSGLGSVNDFENVRFRYGALNRRTEPGVGAQVEGPFEGSLAITV